MNASITELTEGVSRQAGDIPAMYGRVDFSLTPERFTTEPGAQTQLDPRFLDRRPALLANQERVAVVKIFTMRGDPAADAYAALMPKYGFHRLAAMLGEACERGLSEIADAPAELARFVRAMESFPAWLDAKLIDEGARIERNLYAHMAPFVIRGGFIGTFMNKYSALPMALTGALSNKTAARRVKETATFFTTTVLPGALERYGAGMKSAAMVRLMHSMVRFNVLRRPDQWDAKVYGVPIPQVDQLPVALMPAFRLARKALRQGRTTFSRAERARVEMARYRGFLLGVPEELLPSAPQDIVDLLLTRHATLRQRFDETCSALVRATMTADLAPDHSLRGRAYAWLERGFSKLFFVKNFMRGDRCAAGEVGVRLNLIDYLSAATAAILIASRMSTYAIAARIPGVRDAADRSLVRKLRKQLARYGHAEFTTDASTYRPVHA
jgi:ER-bound oxygenase mpaB/B'/Rubber oxygenase, catalytic domain